MFMLIYYKENLYFKYIFNFIHLKSFKSIFQKNQVIIILAVIEV